MKTIAQIAAELGVSKQAVMYHLKKLEATKEHGVLSVKENGILSVSLSGETLIKSAFAHGEHDKQPDKFVDKQPTKESDVLSVLQDTVTVLQTQLVFKDNQIKDLSNRLSEVTAALEHTTAALETAQLTTNAAQALHAGTMKQIGPDQPQEDKQEIIIAAAPAEKKVSFISRLFGSRRT